MGCRKFGDLNYKIECAFRSYYQRIFTENLGTSTTISNALSILSTTKRYLKESLGIPTKKLNALLDLTTTKDIFRNFGGINYIIKCAFYSLYHKGQLQRILGPQLHTISNVLSIHSTTKDFCRKSGDLNYKIKCAFKSHFNKSYFHKIFGPLN